MPYKTDFAFIGLGRMGYRMAANLRRALPASTTLYVNDLNSAACEKFKREVGEHGPVEIAPTAMDAASNASTVFSIVTASAHVRSVYLDEETGVVNAPPDPDRLMLECSTIDLGTTREVQAAIAEAGVGVFLDAPVSGGIQRAADGTLAFLIGHPAPPSDYSSSPTPLQSRIQAAISPMADPDRLIFCGGFSAGLASKIANNYLACSNMAVLAEAFAMGMAAGVNRQVLFECFRKSSGYSWAVDYAQPVPQLVPGPASNGYAVSFLMPMILKDMDLGIGMAGDAGTPTGIGAAVRKVFE
ncbi:NAD binding domain of 6-phosphogluconate dehydrogenase-domain-containing protein, partial [Aspergillus pseudoustus]